MGWIFFLSAQPDLNSGLGLIDTIGRKVLHFATFAGLAALWSWALRPLTSHHLAAAAVLALLYAASDEYHQSFVQGRVGSPLDVAIDWAGVAAATILISRRDRSKPPPSTRPV